MSRRLPRRATALGLLGVTLVLASACRRPDPAEEVRVRFGVFFGGELQEREQIPLIVDRARQSIGARLEFVTPPAEARRVSWELDKPAGKKQGDTGRVVAYGEARTRPGETVLDVPLAFQSDDRPGPWRIRVALDGRRLLDRAFTVTAANEAQPAD